MCRLIKFKQKSEGRLLSQTAIKPIFALQDDGCNCRGQTDVSHHGSIDLSYFNSIQFAANVRKHYH